MNSYLLIFFSLFFLLFEIPLFSTPEQTKSFKEFLMKGNKGDFIVVEQGKTYSLLLLRSIKDSNAVFEEISFPEHAISRSKKITWEKWLHEGAAGHTSWIIFEVDLKNNKILKSYSFSKKEQLYPEDSEYFLVKLLTLPLTLAKEDERKRIGPKPKEGLDNRPLWNPPAIFNGQKIKGLQCEVWRATWPRDESPLSGSLIEFYFDSKTSLFSFPLWIEIKSTHYQFKLRTIDSGKNLNSPKTK